MSLLFSVMKMTTRFLRSKLLMTFVLCRSKRPINPISIRSGFKTNSKILIMVGATADNEDIQFISDSDISVEDARRFLSRIRIDVDGAKRKYGGGLHRFWPFISADDKEALNNVRRKATSLSNQDYVGDDAWGLGRAHDVLAMRQESAELCGEIGIFKKSFYRSGSKRSEYEPSPFWSRVTGKFPSRLYT